MQKALAKSIEKRQQQQPVIDTLKKDVVELLKTAEDEKHILSTKVRLIQAINTSKHLIRICNNAILNFSEFFIRFVCTICNAASLTIFYFINCLLDIRLNKQIP